MIEPFDQDGKSLLLQIVVILERMATNVDSLNKNAAQQYHVMMTGFELICVELELALVSEDKVKAIKSVQDLRHAFMEFLPNTSSKNVQDDQAKQ